MDVDVLFAGVAESDFNAAQAWYEDFFARPPDVVAHEEEVMWQATECGLLYIFRDADHADDSIVTLAMPAVRDTRGPPAP